MKQFSSGKVALPAMLMMVLYSFAFMRGADGCIALSETGLVGVNKEEAVIIWDKSLQTEHFIRSVSLDPKFDEAGFLVPTPTTPELAVADERIFKLAKSYFPVLGSPSKALSAASSNELEPHIIAEQDLGNYHAVILDATDAIGLGTWLKKSHYPWTQSSAEWLKPYLSAHWKITAFKLRLSTVGELSLHAIRMSFKTRRPFFPYREPIEASKLSGPRRVLRVALLSNEHMVDKLGDGTDWVAHLDLAVPTATPSDHHVGKNDWLRYAGFNDRPEILLPARLTYFSDYSNPRPGRSDLFFITNPDQTNYSR